MSVEKNEEWVACIKDVEEKACLLWRHGESHQSENEHITSVFVQQYKDAWNRLIVVTDTLIDASYGKGRESHGADGT